MVGSSASDASRLVLDVVELQRRTGTRRDVRASLVLPDLEVGERCVLDGRLDVHGRAGPGWQHPRARDLGQAVPQGRPVPFITLCYLDGSLWVYVCVLTHTRKVG